MKNKIITTTAFLIFVFSAIQAQQKVTVTGGADLVSAYVWRGSYNAGASVQPSLSMNISGFSIGAWGSTDLGGNGKKEVDLSASYSLNGFRIGITDYWWAGEGTYDYFHYSKKETAHLFEGNISYQLPFEQFPLTLSWNTIFAGADYDLVNNQNYSTYIELAYPFSVGKVDMKGVVGFVPWHSPAFLIVEDKGFNVCNVSLIAEKSIKLTKTFSLPLFSQLIFNPATEDIHFVFGLSLRF